MNGKLFFIATDHLHAMSRGCQKMILPIQHFLVDVNPGTGSSSISNWVAAGGKCFFSFGTKLWYSDGSRSAQISPLIIGNTTTVTNVFGNGNNIFFSGYEYSTGQEIYVGAAGKVALTPKISSTSSDPIEATNFSVNVAPNSCCIKSYFTHKWKFQKYQSHYFGYKWKISLSKDV